MAWIQSCVGCSVDFLNSRVMQNERVVDVQSSFDISVGIKSSSVSNNGRIDDVTSPPQANGGLRRHLSQDPSASVSPPDLIVVTGVLCNNCKTPDAANHLLSAELECCWIRMEQFCEL